MIRARIDRAEKVHAAGFFDVRAPALAAEFASRSPISPAALVSGFSADIGWEILVIKAQ